MTFSQKELANVFGVTTRTIRDWEKQGMPSVGDGNPRKYEAPACIAWRIAEERRRIVEDENAAPRESNLKAARARKEEALATKHEIEVRVRAGELVDAEAVRREFEDQFANLREHLLGWPGRVAAELASELEVDARLVSVALESRIREFLEKRSAA